MDNNYIPLDSIQYLDNWYRFKQSTTSRTAISEAISSLAEKCNSELILIGGQAAGQNYLGFRELRKPSTDVDCVMTLDNLERLVRIYQKTNQVFWSAEYAMYVFDIQGVPFGVFAQTIHDWVIPDLFISTSTREKQNNTSLSLPSPEYASMLKMRRAHSKKRFFGKDRLDIVNMVLAPHFKKRPPFNTDAFLELLSEHVTPDRSAQKELLEQLPLATTNLTKQEKELFKEEYERLSGR